MGEEGALADVGGLGDVGDRDPVEAALGEQSHRLDENAFPGLRPPSGDSIAHGSSVLAESDHGQDLTMVKILRWSLGALEARCFRLLGKRSRVPCALRFSR